MYEIIKCQAPGGLRACARFWSLGGGSDATVEPEISSCFTSFRRIPKVAALRRMDVASSLPSGSCRCSLSRCNLSCRSLRFSWSCTDIERPCWPVSYGLKLAGPVSCWARELLLSDVSQTDCAILPGG